MSMIARAARAVCADRVARTVRIVAVAAAAAVASATLVPACGVVDVGPPITDINTCHPSQTFFVDEIWPNFLDKDYGGRHCSDSGCHDAGSPRLLRLVRPTSDPTIPFATGSEWDRNYLSATNQLNCAIVRASLLYTRPAGLPNHGGGQLISPDGPEALLLDAWVKGP